jgi:hypothetical protein
MFVWLISHYNKNEQDMIKMDIGIHVKYPLYFSDFNNTWISRQIFEKF